jgi:hypothetical protein
MTLAPTSVETHRRPAPRMPEADVSVRSQDFLPLAELLQSEQPEQADDQLLLIDMRYQQHLALRELQGLFESELLPSLES